MFPRLLRRMAITTAHIIGVLAMLWGAGAFWYDLPFPALARKLSAVLLLLLLGFLWFSKSRNRRFAAIGLFLILLIWWFSLRPSNRRPWLQDADRTAWAVVDGDQVTFHNIRNCDYRTETDFTPHWETRTVDMSKLTGIDVALTYWGSPYMAHPIISFQFADAPPVCFSIETRKEMGESYSSIGGLYRQYELIYFVADERDVIRLRTNFRKGEDVYLYRLNITPEHTRERFIDYVTTLNSLHAKPRWYNAITTNCTTAIRTQHSANKRMRWDWRILINGKSDEMLYELGALQTGGLPFPELKKRSHINPLVRDASDRPDFSALIRTQLPVNPSPSP